MDKLSTARKKFRVIYWKKEWLVILLREFLETFYSKNGIDSQPGPFVIEIFDAVGCPYFSTPSRQGDASKFMVNKTLTASMVFPLRKENPIESTTEYFVGKLSDGRLSRIATDFGYTAGSVLKLPLAYALAKKLISIIKTVDHDVTDSNDFKAWYERALSVPYCYMNDERNIEFINLLCNEVDGLCPMTGKKLNPNDSTTYKVIHIYEKSISQELKDELLSSFSIKEPENEDDYENCLLVSSSFNKVAISLIPNAERDEIVDLYNIKRGIILKAEIKAELNNYEISEKLKECVKKLSNSSIAHIKVDKEIFYDPIAIETKLGTEYYDEIYSIISSQYYTKIKTYFNSYTDLSTSELNNVLSSVRDAYEAISTTTTDKRLIIDEIKKWISREILNPSEYATFDMQCLILVCYFIQDCEVFGHEVS